MATASERAQRHAANLQSAARPYTRGGYRWVITDFRAEGNMLVVTARVHRGTNQQGPVVIAEDDPLNPMCIVNPITQVDDGTDINGAPKYREDLTEALRVMLDRHLAMRLGGNA